MQYTSTLQPLLRWANLKVTFCFFDFYFIFFWASHASSYSGATHSWKCSSSRDRLSGCTRPMRMTRWL